MPEPRPRLYLIDGYSNIFRAFYAIRNLSTSKGEPTNAVYGFVTMLRKLLREEKPELIGVALDVSRRTVRTERYADYKANRTPMPDDLRSQMPWIRKALEAYRIPVLEIEKYEADDVLGSLAARASGEGYDVVLVSADKDLMQLVAPGVSLYHTGREKLYDPAGVTEDFGVPPEKVTDVLALTGDTSDNVPGVPGIGEKGARQLITEHGSLESLLEHAGEVSRKSYREGLEQHAEQARMSKELVTIHRDLPVAFEPDRLQLEEPDAEALRKLFTELEFFSLAEELGPAGAAGGFGPATEAETAGSWEAGVAKLSGPLLVALVGPDGAPEGLAVGAVEAGAADGSSGDGAGDGGGHALFADFRRPGLRDVALATLAARAADPEAELVGHDLKEALRLLPDGDRCRAKLFDTMLASYLVRAAAHGHSVEELALERAGIKAMTAKDAGWERDQRPAVGDSRLTAFAGERIALTRKIAPGMRRELGDPDDPEGGALARLYRDLEAPLLPILLGMEECGILLDVPYLEAMSRELAGELTRIETAIYAVAGETFNINSPQQLGALMFEKLGYPVIKRTRKTRSYATGAEILEELAERGYELATHILRYRELSKLKSTYVDALPVLVDAGGRLHTRYYQAVAATGRLSSANPNLQNIPVRTELGQRIRRAFIAPEGRLLLVADYSQIELRVLAHIAGEQALLDAFRAGEDIHRTTAATVFGVSPGLVTGEQRRAAKVINFGILYGMSAFGLAKTLRIPNKEAQEFIDAYLGRFPSVRRYIEETLAVAEAEGKVETLYGRIRWLPDIQSKNRALRENARRMAINARIQGTAADLMKMAMLAVARRLTAESPDSRLLLTVHDELVLEVPAAEAEEVGRLVKAEMEGVAELAAPLAVELGTGRSWYDAKE
jgi:DNA polymerase-1